MLSTRSFFVIIQLISFAFSETMCSDSIFNTAVALFTPTATNGASGSIRINYKEEFKSSLHANIHVKLNVSNLNLSTITKLYPKCHDVILEWHLHSEWGLKKIPTLFQIVLLQQPVDIMIQPLPVVLAHNIRLNRFVKNEKHLMIVLQVPFSRLGFLVKWAIYQENLVHLNPMLLVSLIKNIKISFSHRMTLSVS